MTHEEMAKGRYRKGEGIIGRVVKNKKPIGVKDVHKEPKFLDRTGAFPPSREKTSFMAIPILLENEVVGVLGAAKVFPGDPADRAGIKPKDIIREVNGKKVKTSRDLSRMIAQVPVGKKITLKVLRDKKERDIKVVITKQTGEKIPSRPSEYESASILGLHVSDMTSELARRFRRSQTSGVIVVGVEEGSKAKAAGLRPGDIIAEINHIQVESVAEFHREMARLGKGESLQIVVQRETGFRVFKLEK